MFHKNIDKIGFRSSFLSSEVAKLLSVVVHEIRINKDVKGQNLHGQAEPWQPPPSFHNQKIPPIVITFAQVKLSSVRRGNIYMYYLSYGLCILITKIVLSRSQSIVGTVQIGFGRN